MGKTLSAIFILVLVTTMALGTIVPAAANGEPVVVNLIAGQDINVGTVTITDDGTNLTVTYQTDAGWTLMETHLAVEAIFADIPQTQKGNPKVGKFEYGDEGINDDTMTYVVTIPSGAETLYIAAHAVVVNDEVVEETAWGSGKPFPGNNWAMYIVYKIDGNSGGGQL